MDKEALPVSNFNILSVEIRSKIEGLIKQVLLLSGGTQAITIGAFLSGTPPRLPPQANELLQFGWLSLSACIVLCLVFMLGHVFAMICVGLKSKNKLKNGRPGVEILEAPLPLRILNWITGLLAFVTCAVGIVVLSMAATALIGAYVCA